MDFEGRFEVNASIDSLFNAQPRVVYCQSALATSMVPMKSPFSS